MEISRADTPSPIRIWADIMTNIHEELEIQNFTMSENVVSRKVCAESGMLPTQWCPKTITEFFDSTKKLTFPQIPCTLHDEETVEQPETKPSETEPTGPEIIVPPEGTTQDPPAPPYDP